MSTEQIKNTLDPVSQLKIYKGMVIALSGAVGVLVLLVLWGIGADKAMLAAFISWLLPTVVNSVNQFTKGSDSSSTEQQ